MSKMKPPFRPFLFTLCLGLALASCQGWSEEKPKTTRVLLNKFNTELSDTWRDYPSEKQKVARDQHISDLTTAITKDLTTVDTPPDVTLGKALAYYLDQVDGARQTFRLEKMLPTRTTYLAACATVFKRETAASTDYAAARTTQQTYDLLLQWMESARDKLRASPLDAQTQVYNEIGALFSNLLRAATVPEKTDHIAALDANIRESRRKFPVSSEALSKNNMAIFSMLESKAKEVQQKAAKQQ
jgi:hypothetical protein